MTTLAIAAGGGGDALGALLAADLIHGLTDPPLIATLAWERLRLDPTPGPRGVDGFERLGLINGAASEVLPMSQPSDVHAWSSLPRLVRDTGARVFILDAHEGAQGLSQQLVHLRDSLAIDELAVVDVGGDAVARGNEPNLRSPLADALVVAAANETGLAGHVLVAGPGLDAELTEQETLDRLTTLGADFLGTIPPPRRELIEVLSWHPSEASALLASAAMGVTGQVDMRRGERFVPLTRHSAGAWRCRLEVVAEQNLYARVVRSSSTLGEAERMASAIGPTELSFERAKAANRVAGGTSSPEDLASHVARFATAARNRGADYVTTRRIAEAVGLPGPGTPRLIELLGALPSPRSGCLWRTDALSRVG